MTRRSGRLSGTGTATGKHKRAASGSSAADLVPKKAKKQHATPTKSQYFESNDEDPADSNEVSDSSSAADSGSDFADPEHEEDAISGPAQSAEDDEDEEDEENENSEADRPRSKKLSKMRPGTQVIFKKPKARPAGKVPYTDETIHPNTLLFLADLKANNKREWLKANDPEFRQAEKDFHSFVQAMTGKLVEIDDTVPELPVKDLIFRVYRDVRFSKDPTPYKPWFSLAWSRTGRKGAYAHYYLQIAPNNSFVGGGKWHPEAPAVNSLRTAIDRNARGLKDTLSDPRIRKEFLKGASNNDAAVVKEFVRSNADNALKTKPKGFSAEHPDINLLRLRNYTIGRKLSDDEVLGEAGRKRIMELLASLKPFITYLNSVVMPDEDDGNDEAENEEESEEDQAGGEESDEEEDDSE